MLQEYHVFSPFLLLQLYTLARILKAKSQVIKNKMACIFFILDAFDGRE
jgi:hypothetical protein